MKNLDFEWLTDEFMLYCRSTQLREKTMSSYEQTLHLFGRWLSDELQIYTVVFPPNPYLLLSNFFVYNFISHLRQLLFKSVLSNSIAY